MFWECVKEGKTLFFCIVFILFYFFLLMGFYFHNKWLKELGTKLRNKVILNIIFIKIKVFFISRVRIQLQLEKMMSIFVIILSLLKKKVFAIATTITYDSGCYLEISCFTLLSKACYFFFFLFKKINFKSETSSLSYSYEHASISLKT